MDRGEQPSQHTSQVLQTSDPDQEQLFTVSYSCQIPKDFQPLSDPNLNFAFTWSCNCEYNGPRTNTTCSCMNAEVEISMVDTIRFVREKPVDTGLTVVEPSSQIPTGSRNQENQPTPRDISTPSTTEARSKLPRHLREKWIVAHKQIKTDSSAGNFPSGDPLPVIEQSWHIQIPVNESLD